MMCSRWRTGDREKEGQGRSDWVDAYGRFTHLVPWLCYQYEPNTIKSPSFIDLVQI